MSSSSKVVVLDQANGNGAAEGSETREGRTMVVLSQDRGPIRSYNGRLIPSRLMQCRKCGSTHRAYAPYSNASWFCVHPECNPSPWAARLAEVFA